MKEKYREWAEAIKEICDLLQSLADMPDEPDRNQAAVHDPNTDTESAKVDAEYADWWQAKCVKIEWRNKNQSDWLIEQDAKLESQRKDLAAAKTQLANTQQLVRDLQQEIESKDARIKQLEHSLLDTMTAENQAMGLYNDQSNNGANWTFCQFVGPAPDGFTSWAQWTEGRNYSSVKVQSVFHVEDQPPRPVLTLEQFSSITDLIHSFCKLYTTTHSMNYVRDFHDPIYKKTRKLLVGE